MNKYSRDFRSQHDPYRSSNIPGDVHVHNIPTLKDTKKPCCSKQAVLRSIVAACFLLVIGGVVAVVLTQTVLQNTESNCTSTQYYCTTSEICISAKYHCDGINDCSNNDDEVNCESSCSATEFYCSDNSDSFGFCIPSSWNCDTQNDCRDGADEVGCDTVVDPATFLCDLDMVKVKKSKVCDGSFDCTGQQDEDNCVTSDDGLGSNVKIYHPENEAYFGICSNNWDSSKSDVVCEELGYSSADSTSTVVTTEPLITSSTSFTNARTLTSVGPDSCSSGQRVSITCTPHSSCGTKKTTNRIVGGVSTPVEDQPWMVVLQEFSSLSWSAYCGGAIVNNRHIVTAAHCVTIIKSTEQSSYRILSGTSYPTSGGQASSISTITIHPSYDDDTNQADIAIIKIDETLLFSSVRQPICLPTPRQDFATGSTVTVSGWGLLSDQGAEPNILQSVQLEIISHTQCKQSYPHLTNQMICAGWPTGGKDACQGDSGSPLVQLANGRYTLVGVVSFGTGCGDSQYPGVYVDVAVMVDWIRRNVI